MAEKWEPTPAEMRVLTPLAIVLPIMGVVVVVIGNVTGSWWPALASLAFDAVLVVGVTVWAARTRQQSVWTTVVQIGRSPSKRSS